MRKFICLLVNADELKTVTLELTLRSIIFVIVGFYSTLTSLFSLRFNQQNDQEVFDDTSAKV